jgi:DNA-binding response OmpR family regulator
LSDSGWAIERGQGAVGRFVQASAPRGRACALVVEGPVDEGGSLAACLAGAGFEVRARLDGPTALDAFVRELPDLIVTRDRLEGLDGWELVRRVRELSDVPIVLVGSIDTPANRERAVRIGVDQWLAGPGEIASLSQLALDLADRIRSARLGPRLTAAHVRRVARSELQAELARLLVDCRGNLAEMARRMGKDRSTVRYHLRRFGMLAEARGEGVRAGGAGAPCGDGSASA